MGSLTSCSLPEELLRTGNLELKRKDGNELRAIQAGTYEPEAFVVIEKRPDNEGKMRDEIVGGMMLREYKNLMEAAAATKLADQPDVERINRVILRLTERKLEIESKKRERIR